MKTQAIDVFQRQLGRRLKALRTGCGLTQREVAAYVGLSRVAVGYFEQGRRLPSVGTLYSLAGLYGMTISELCDVDSRPSYRVGCSIS